MAGINTDLSGYNLFKKVENMPKNPLSGNMGGVLGVVNQKTPVVPAMTGEELGLGGGQNQVTDAGKGLAESGGVFGTGPRLNYAENKPVITNTEELANAMGYTSPEEEKRLRQASVNNQRILAVADALRHIGNIANTVNYAPAQQFNQPWKEAKSEYERGKALRDAANYKYMSYQQAKAEQERKMRQLSDATDIKLKQLAFNQDKFNRQQNLNEFKANLDKWYKEATVEQKEKALGIQQQLAEGRISLMEAQTALNKVKTAAGGFAPKKGSSGGGSKSRGKAGSGGGKYWAYDESGNIHYYPNKTMWEQAVNQFSSGLDNTETYNSGTDAFGKPQQRGRARSAASKGGELARKAQKGKGSASGFSIRGKGKGQGGSFSGFSIHNK